MRIWGKLILFSQNLSLCIFSIDFWSIKYIWNSNNKKRITIMNLYVTNSLLRKYKICTEMTNWMFYWMLIANLFSFNQSLKAPYNSQKWKDKSTQATCRTIIKYNSYPWLYNMNTNNWGSILHVDKYQIKHYIILYIVVKKLIIITKLLQNYKFELIKIIGILKYTYRMKFYFTYFTLLTTF